MTNEGLNKIIEHQAMLYLSERGIKKGELTEVEYLKIKYEIALDMMSEFLKDDK